MSNEPTYIDNETVLAAQAGDPKALEALVLHMSGRIGKIPKYTGRSHYPEAGGFAGKVAYTSSNDIHEDSMDIVQEGYVAILEALPRWDPSKGSFETFVYRTMRGSMVETLEQHSNSPSIPTNARKCYLRIMRAVDHDPAEGYKRAPEFEMSQANFADVHRAMTMTTSVSAYEGEEAEGDDEGTDAMDIAQTEEGYEQVTSTMQGEAYMKLLEPRLEANARERAAAHRRQIIVDLVYGLSSREPMTHKAVAKVLGISEQAVGQHLTKALEIMREAGR